MWSIAERYQAVKQMDERGWVSLRGAAKVLGVSYPTIQRMKNDGRIITTDTGTHRVEREEVQRVAEAIGAPSIHYLRRSVQIVSEEDTTSDFLSLDAWQEE